MSVSFKDSLEKAQKAEILDSSFAVATAEFIAPSVADAAVASAEPATMVAEYSIAAYDGADGNWYDIAGYDRYSFLSDDKLSIVDHNKEIKLDGSQFNITQEENSQYIPFEMPRYYDGYDLSQATLAIIYHTNGGEHKPAKPVNVSCNNEKIRFGWLLDADATAEAGKLKFEIHAYGSITNDRGVPKGYSWKTKSNETLNILPSLCAASECDEEIVNKVNDKTWITTLVTQVANSVAEKIANAQIGSQVLAAENAASRAEQAASDAEDIARELLTTELANYSTTTEMQTYVSQEIANADIEGKLSAYAKSADVASLVGELGESANVIEYVDKAVQSVDVTEQLKDYVPSAVLEENYYNKNNTTQLINSSIDQRGFATETYVAEAVAAADISDKLSDYYKKEETYSRDEIDNALNNVQVDLTGYATEKHVNDVVAPIASATTTNAGNITALSQTVSGLQDVVNSIDTSPRRTYDVDYNDAENPDVGENVFVFYEIENAGAEDEKKEIIKKFTITGGSGGSSTSSSLKIGYVTTSPLVVTVDDKAIIKYTFTGTDSSGDAVTEGNAVWKIGGRVIATNTAIAGENEFDVTEYLSIGTQKVNLTITDDAGSLVSKNWTVQKIDVRLESSFNDKLTYPMGTVSFDFTPYGAISKDIHFILDGKEIATMTTVSSGIPMSYNLPAKEHGAHLLEVYMTGNVNGNPIESNHIVKDILWYDSTSTAPVIGTTYQNFTARQYDATNIEYTVYDPTTETPTVTIAVDGVVVSTPTLDKATNVYSYKTDVVGKHTITITCGTTVKTLTANITKLDININPVTAGLIFDFNPSGKSNNDVDRVWSNDTVAMSVSDNFEWVNGGYQYDENGDQYFCIKAGTSAEINYQLFADDAKKNGKEFKLVFKTTNVAKPNATFLSCMDNTTGTDHIGIQMDVHEANIYGQAGNLQLPYSEEDIIEFEFNISKNTEAIPMVMGYEDGVSTRPMVYDDSYNFTQNTPKVISLGSEDCDLHIYRFKVYNTSLTDRGILNNFIADARNAEEMVARYDRNQIYNENSQLDPDIFAAKCPWLRVYKLSAPYFTNNKSDKVPGTTIQQIYKGGDPVFDNWTCYNAMHSGQGTSSNNYGAAGRNLDFIMNDSGIDGVSPYFKLGNGTEATEITMTRTSVPVAYLNAKVNIASSNNMTNAMLANRYNEFNPYKRPFVRGEGVDTTFIKDTMEFHNCVIFIQETNEDLSTHREFADTNWHFYAIGNIGDSKKTDKTRKTDIDDPYEFCVEIMDVELPLSDWPANTMYNAMGYTVDEKTEEKIYTWAKNENLGILHELIDGEYVLTQDTEVDLNKTYYVDILEHDDFSEDFTYGWRYISNKKDPAIVNFCKQKWIEFYRFVTTSTDEEFKAHLSDYMVVDTALYYYLFTTRYTMIDNRAKNSFWHYSKTGEIDAQGNPIRKFDLSWMYDCDSSLGLNNYGMQAYRYGLEDIDRDEKGEEIFREMDSTFFCRVRNLFSSELKAMYNTLESKNAWHAESFINKADEWQSQFPEELWRIDIERKYLRTYNSSFINGKGDAQFLTNMSNGKMKYHRRQWERSQEKYMASKYQSSVASGDNSVFRCSVPDGDLAVQPNYRLKLTPYAYMYLNVKYGTQSPIQLRAEPNKVYEIPFDGEKADIVDVYSASLIQDFGDLSTCYVATADTSKASKVKKLIFGNDTEGYDNPNFTTLTTGANYLLEELNIENVSGLTQALNLSALNNLRELYAHGSNIGGVTFADGGKIEIAELPAINALSMKNLMYLVTLDITDLSKLTTLTVENCSTVDLLTMLDNAPNLNRIRLTGVNWALEDISLLERLYALKGIDKNGYNTDQSILSGSVQLPIIGQYDLYKYQAAWPDLLIEATTIKPQFKVEFVNDDGTVLDTQYVEQFASAIDPLTRDDNPIPVPEKMSTIQYVYTFDGWDSVLTNVISDRIIKATYKEALRGYTAKYVSNGVVVHSADGLYGDNIPYNDIPVYTAEEPHAFYLFNRWDKSGFLDGDIDANGIKTINAIFDKFVYSADAFADKELSDLSPVEIYAMNKLGLAENILQEKDAYTITVGNDVEYDDIASEVLIDKKTHFDGTKYIDTGIHLFDEDKDFVFAVDYEMLAGNKANAVLMQCFQEGSNVGGLRLWYGTDATFNGAKFTWGSASDNIVSVGKREMLIVRHKKGDNNLVIYKSNLDGESVSSVELARTKSTINNATLIFGASNPEEGYYENRAIGNIYWSKIWYKDLGDDVCKSLAMWTHETIDMEVSGFKRYYLSDNPAKRCSFSMLASNLLHSNRQWNPSSTSEGGWAKSALNKILNTRLYNAMPNQIKALMKQVIVYSSVGQKSTELSASNCYITIPALIDVSAAETTEPYFSEGKTISYLTTNASRKRAHIGGDYNDYWLRSPNVGYDAYVYRVSNEGVVSPITTPSSSYGVLIEISF